MSVIQNMSHCLKYSAHTSRSARIVHPARASAVSAAAFWPRVAITAATENVDPVDCMQHGIAVNAVIPRVAALHGIDCSAEIALLVQDVIQLQ